ncbi:hypothetical protein MNV49_007754 [Pseudohyphozyma bogoriensis]|nr:hypothetical protein MNV49_007754 [Pseudohyphozyma bogoriensis]
MREKSSTFKLASLVSTLSTRASDAVASLPPLSQVPSTISHFWVARQESVDEFITTLTRKIVSLSDSLVDSSPILQSILAHPTLAPYLPSQEVWVPVLLKALVSATFIAFLKKYNDSRIEAQLQDAARKKYLKENPDMIDFGVQKNQHGEVEVHWGRERLIVPLPPPASPLSALKATLYNLTAVPPEHQKLISSGAVLKDDLLPLSSYNLVAAQPSSSSSGFWGNWVGNKGVKLKKLVLVGDKDIARVLDRKVPEEVVVVKEQDSEEVVIRKIGEILDKAAETEAKIPKVEAWKRKEAGEDVEVEGDKPDAREPAWLSEVLLQSLLKLDSLDIPSTYAEGRKERKAAVKKLQASLDRVDVLLGRQ